MNCNGKNEKTLIKGMCLKELEDWCIFNNKPPYRAQQLYEWLYSHGIDNVRKMYNIPNDFKELINKTAIISTLELESKVSSSKNETVKYLFKTLDGKLIESVSMLDDLGRHTVCISSQSGCNVGCDFCATAKMGLIKNLSSGEIVDQLIIIRSISKKRINNIVYMGMGEPFLNYNNVIKSANIFNNKKGFNVSANKITISTVGIIPKIIQFIKEKVKYKLAISLNAPNDQIRDHIIPINKKWPISDLIKVNKIYTTQYKRKKITFEYVVMDGINSSQNDAIELARILKSSKCKLNIIPYNEINGKYKRPNISTINNFIDTLSKYNKNDFQLMVRWSNGLDIDAGCGQLAISN